MQAGDVRNGTKYAEHLIYKSPRSAIDYFGKELLRQVAEANGEKVAQANLKNKKPTIGFPERLP